VPISLPPVPLAIWPELLDPGEPPWAKILRTVAVYLFLLVLLRLGGKRELGQLSTLDLIVLLLLSNTVQNAIIGDDLSLTGGMLGAGVLIVLDKGLTWLGYRSRRVSHLLGGDPTALIAGGRLLEANLRRQRITEDELATICRRQGIDRLEDVDAATLETDGTITVRPRHPTPEERIQAEILARLSAIERLLADGNDRSPTSTPDG